MYEGTITYDNKLIPHHLAKDMEELNREFINYLNFGGYPEVVLIRTYSVIQADMLKKWQKYKKARKANCRF